MASVIVGEQVDSFRLKVIASALRLECRGLKGRFKASNIARGILLENNIKPERSLLKLSEQFKKFVENTH
jgi:hypothetical protein